MPQRPPRLCAHPGCGEKVKTGYCEKHSRRPDNRPTSTRRGYDKNWSRFRSMYLARHPFCVMCEKEGRTTTADMIHHIAPLADGGNKYDESNLMPVCGKHHRDIHGFGNNKLKA